MIEESVQLVKTFVPEFTVRNKADSKLHSLIGWILKHIGNPIYTETFWTTFGYTTWKPLDADSSSWRTIFHEGRHALDAKRLTRLLFGFLYLLPLSLVPILIILGITLSPWWFTGIALCLLPLPSPFRMWAELRGYTVSLAIKHWLGHDLNDPWETDRVEQMFTSGQYYYMWPFKKHIKYKVLKVKNDIQSGNILTDQYLAAIKLWIEKI